MCGLHGISGGESHDILPIHIVSIEAFFLKNNSHLRDVGNRLLQLKLIRTSTYLHRMGSTDHLSGTSIQLSF